MPRNSFGVYSLPSGNPVVSDTIIETDWANPTLDDIGSELTASLPRNGAAGMTGPFKVSDGSEASPAVSFTTAANTGMWKNGTSVAFSVAGVKKFEITSSGVSIVGSVTQTGNVTLTGNISATGNVSAGGVFLAADGSVSAPAFSFTNDPDTGIYRTSSGDIRFSSNGVLHAAFLTGATYFRNVLYGPAGTVGAPAYAFESDTDTGMYLVSDSNLGFSVGGTTVFNVTVSGIATAYRIAGTRGTAAAPGYSFYDDLDTGMYSHDTNTLDFATSGAARWQVGTTGHFMPHQTSTFDIGGSGNVVRNIYASVYRAQGSASVPGFSFITDTDTGMDHYSSDGIGFSCAGSLSVMIEPNGQVVLAGSPNCTVRNNGGGTLVFATGTDNWAISTSNNFIPVSSEVYDIGTTGSLVRATHTQHLVLKDGMTPPGPTSGLAYIYVDSSDGDLKVRFGDNVIKTIATDT